MPRVISKGVSANFSAVMAELLNWQTPPVICNHQNSIYTGDPRCLHFDIGAQRRIVSAGSHFRLTFPNMQAHGVIASFLVLVPDDILDNPSYECFDPDSTCMHWHFHCCPNPDTCDSPVQNVGVTVIPNNNQVFLAGIAVNRIN